MSPFLGRGCHDQAAGNNQDVVAFMINCIIHLSVCLSVRLSFFLSVRFGFVIALSAFPSLSFPLYLSSAPPKACWKNA